MRIGLIRHGETDWNAAGRLQGTTDIPLNARGISQSKDAAQFIGGQGWSQVYCSPLTRTRDTAQFFADELQIGTPTVLAAVIERSFGDLEGELVYLEDGSRRSLDHPTVESTDTVVERVLPALRELASTHPHDDVLVITHGSVVRLVLQAILGRTAPGINNLGYSVIETADSPTGFVVRVANGYPVAT